MSYDKLVDAIEKRQDRDPGLQFKARGSDLTPKAQTARGKMDMSDFMNT